MKHTCLCLPSRSWYSFTDPEGWKAELALDAWDFTILLIFSAVNDISNQFTYTAHTAALKLCLRLASWWHSLMMMMTQVILVSEIWPVMCWTWPVMCWVRHNNSSRLVQVVNVSHGWFLHKHCGLLQESSSHLQPLRWQKLKPIKLPVPRPWSSRWLSQLTTLRI